MELKMCIRDRTETPAPEQNVTPAPEQTETPAPEQTVTPAPEPVSYTHLPKFQLSLFQVLQTI